MKLKCIECGKMVDDDIVDVEVIKDYYPSTEDHTDYKKVKDATVCYDCLPADYNRCNECKDMFYMDDLTNLPKDIEQYDDFEYCYPCKEDICKIYK